MEIKHLACAAGILSILVLVGCSGPQRQVDSQNIPITTFLGTEKVKESGAVYLWPPYSSAAVIDGKGNRCVLTATGAKTTRVKSEDAAKLGDLMGKLQGLDLSQKQEFEELFVKLTNADSKTAFVDVALFHLCMFDQNGTFAETKKDSDGVVRDHKFKANLVRDAYIATVKAASGAP